MDLAHNFVLADSRCNNQNRDRLPACDHLAAWTERNARYGAQLGDALGRHGIVGELAPSNRVAQWAYAQTEAARGLTWLRGRDSAAGGCVVDAGGVAWEPFSPSWSTWIAAN